MKRLYYLDTTLRDGEQSLGYTLDKYQKLEIAEQLVKLGVDIIEAGFPASSPGDYSSVQEIAAKIKGTTVCGLARCVKKDIDLCVAALKKAESPMINIGLGVSPLHMEKKLRLKPQEVIEKAITSVWQAKKCLSEVQFYAEDALRSDPVFLKELIEKVIKAGATVITVSDTVGCSTPWKYAEMIMYLKENVKNIDKVRISTHCHNDLGMATANTLAGILVGAEQVEGTINGIGERAGNAALEEVMISVAKHAEYKHLYSSINTKEIYPTSHLVAEVIQIPIPCNKALVGSNVFTHYSGIHQDGVIKERRTYEIIDPESIGAPPTKLRLSARSGKNALKNRLGELGYKYQPKDIEKIYKRFVKIADEKKKVSKELLCSLLE